MANGATDDTSQYISAVLIGRKDSVVDEHDRRTRVFGQHPQTETTFVFVVADDVLLRTDATLSKLFPSISATRCSRDLSVLHLRFFCSKLSVQSPLAILHIVEKHLKLLLAQRVEYHQNSDLQLSWVL